jgi:PAS domain S-box-containing protein
MENKPIKAAPVDLPQKAQLEIPTLGKEPADAQIIRLGFDAFEACAQGIIIGMPGTNQILTCNPAFARAQGRTVEEIAGMPILSMYAPDEHEHIRQSIANADRTGRHVFRSRMVRKDGSIYPVEMDLVSIYDENGKPVYRVATQQNITDQIQAEEKLRASEQFVHATMDALSAHICVLDETGRIVMVNQAWLDFAKNNEGILEKIGEGVNYLKVCEEAARSDKTAQTFSDGIRAVMSGGQNEFILEYPCHSPTENRWFTGKVTRLSLQNSNWVVIAHDNITERKLAEDAVRESESRFRALIANAGDLIVVINEEGKIVFASPSSIHIMGYTPEQAVGTSFLNWIQPEDIPQVVEAFENRRITPGLAKERVKVRARHADGSWRIMDALGTNLLDDPAVRGIVLNIRDVTETELAEKALRESESNFKRAQKVSHTGSWYLNISNNRLKWTEETYHIFGVPFSTPLTHETFINCIHPEDRERVNQKWSEALTGAHYDVEYRILVGEKVKWIREQAEVQFDANGTPQFSIGTVQDITKRKHTENERQVLLEVMQGLAFSRDVREFLSLVHKALGRVISARNFFVTLYNPYTELFEDVYVVDKYDEPMRPTKREKTLTSHIFHTRASFLSKDESFERLVASGEVQLVGTAFKSFLGVPLISSGNTIGVMVVQDYEKENLYSEHDADFVMTIGGQVALAVERKQAEEELKQSNRRFTQIASNISDIFWVSEPITRKNIYVSPAFESIVGMSIGSALELQNGFLDIVLPEDSYILKEAREREDSGIKSDVQYRLRRADGSVRWIRDRGSPILDEKGRVVLIVGIARDVTEQVEAQIQLQESEMRFRQIAESIQEVFWMFDEQERHIIYVSPAYDAIWGRSHEVLYQDVNRSIEFVIEEDRHILRESREIQKNRQPSDSEYRILRPDGSTRWIWRRTFPIMGHDGKLIRTVGIDTDVTENKTTHLELIRSEEKYRRLSAELEQRVKERTAEVRDLYENSPAGYHSLDADGRFAMINQTELNWLGYKREEVIGHSFQEFISEQSRIKFQENFSVFKKAGSVREIELDLVRKDGTYLPVMLSSSVLFNQQGNFIMSRSTVFDNTERKKAEQALRKSRDELSAANAALEKAARLKDEFLASMSHELRTPLTGILGLSEALQLKTYGELSPKQMKTVKNIEDSGRHLLELINDILDLSKIEAGKVTLQFAPCSLADICQASLQLTKGMAQQKQQTVSYLPPEVPILLRADARRLKQILVNLLSNAVKFTTEGGSLGLEVHADEPGRKVKITVWDTGIGIKPEDQHKLFKPFTQIDSSLAREYSGTGLGLSLVKRLTELHNGGIEVESVFGKGSRFTISLPWSPQNTTPIPYVPHYQMDTLPSTTNTSGTSTIIVADDNEIVLQMIADFLETKKYRVIKVRNGVELLEVASDSHPNIMLIDIQMPGMDGLETIRRIRRHKDPLVASARVIAITALAMSGDRERCIEAGANEYMSKPIRLNELMEIIQKILG